MPDPLVSDPYCAPRLSTAGCACEGDMALLSGIKGLVTWTWEVPTNTVVYSHEWRNVLQRPDDGSVQTSLDDWWPQVHEDDVRPFLEAARNIVEGVTEEYQTLFRVQRDDGKWAWLLSRGRVVEKKNGHPLRVCGALMDITFLRADMKFQIGGAAMSIPRFHAMPPRPVHEKQSGYTETVPRRVNFESARHLLSAGAEVFTNSGCGAFEEVGPELRTRLQECVKKIFADGQALREKVTFATDYGHTVAGEYFF